MIAIQPWRVTVDSESAHSGTGTAIALDEVEGMTWIFIVFDESRQAHWVNKTLVQWDVAP